MLLRDSERDGPSTGEEWYSPFAELDSGGVGNQQATEATEGYAQPPFETPRQEGSQTELGESERIEQESEAAPQLDVGPARPPAPASEMTEFQVPREGPGFIRWAQASLSKILQLRVPPTGQLDPVTRSAIRRLQKRSGIPQSGVLNARTRHLLALAAVPRTKSELSEAFEGEYVKRDDQMEAAAAVGTAFEILKTTITALQAGDVRFEGPSSTIGVRWPGKPTGLRFNATRDSRLIMNYREVHPLFGYEFANIKLRCKIEFNGPEIEVTFAFEPDGKRSRLQTDAVVTIQNPLLLETRPTTAEWQKLGVPEYPVIRIPVELRVDRMWPWSNYNESFELVLSGMYGFGPSLDKCYIVDRRACWDTDCSNLGSVCRNYQPRVRVG